MCPAQHSIATEDGEKDTRGIINSSFQRVISTNELRGRECPEEGTVCPKSKGGEEQHVSRE